jgi:ABC-type phosphate/phosphonate transport system substrate-binding protein
VIIETLPAVPNDAIVLSLELDIDARDTVRDALADHQDDLADLLGVDSLDDLNDEAYEELRALFEAAGIDPIVMGE